MEYSIGSDKKYLMSDLKIILINDAVFFSLDEKTSILDKQKYLPLGNKKASTFIEFVKDNGENTYYSTNFPIGCVEFLTMIDKPQSKIGNIILKFYTQLKSEDFGLSTYLNLCEKTDVTENELLSLFVDITNGYDRKKAMVRVAQKIRTDDFGAVPKKLIKEELKQIEIERATRIIKGYKNFEDKEF